MSAASGLPDFLAIARDAHAKAGPDGAAALLDAGRALADAADLAGTLRAGGSVIFPHAGYLTCGHQVAAAVHACLDSGADRVLALGVLHARTPEMRAVAARVAAGGRAEGEPFRGVQGPGLAGDGGRDEWKGEWSLAHFEHLLREEVRRRGASGPELVMRFPFLVGGRPETLPGIEELEAIARDAAVVVTMDAFHHGIGYGTPEAEARAPESGGLELARSRIPEGLGLLREGKLLEFVAHCVANKSDGRDVGQVLWHLRGGMEARVLDVVADDTAAAYGEPAPTWVACALVGMSPR